MYVIGLTGGVGSGKTEAAHMLARIADAEILLADKLGHLAMEKDTKGYQQIVQCFGTSILEEQGNICRERLANIVFGKKEELEKLNGIVHPIVKEYLQTYIADRKEQRGYIILESAIMFETACDALCDEIWYISVPVDIRKERLQQSRGYSKQKSESIMQQQLQEEEYKSRCHRTIENDGDLEELHHKLKKAFERL